MLLNKLSNNFLIMNNSRIYFYNLIFIFKNNIYNLHMSIDLTTTTTNDEANPKSIQSVADKLKEVFKCLVDGDLNELKSLLSDGNALTQKSLNISLERACGYYKSDNNTSKEIIAVLLK